MNLDRLFRPDSIAVIGASSTEGKLGHEAMANVYDYGGTVYPVNPSGEGELFGAPFVESIGDIEEDVDLALCCVPAHITPDVIEACGQANVGAAIIYAGGFGETDADGEVLEDRIIDAATTYDIAVLGPNTAGYFMPPENLYTTFASNPDVVESGPVAVVAQSGGLAHSIAFQGVNADRGFSGIVGLGNRAVLDFKPVIEYFDGDPDTDAILLHVEGTEKARELMETCGAVDTPVFAYPVGKHDVDSFTASHTGALTGDYELYTAGFEQYGVPTVDSTETLIDAGHLCSMVSPPDGQNVGIITAQAGPGIVIADTLQSHGASVPPLTDDTQEQINDILPGITFTENPIDTARPTENFVDIIEHTGRDPNVDVVIVYMIYEAAVGYPPMELASVPDAIEKPVVFVTDGPDQFIDDDLQDLEDTGVPVFRSPERGANALGTLLRYVAVQNDDLDEEVHA